MTISTCDMQSEDCKAQILFWQNLNLVMESNGLETVNFKGFMADNAQCSSSDCVWKWEEGRPHGGQREDLPVLLDTVYGRSYREAHSQRAMGTT